MAAGGSNRLLTPDELAEKLGITKRVLMAEYRRWGLKPTRVGRHIRFRERHVEAWIEENTE
ncbi:helix-turn-helix domain-containing protein [Kitasatospora purpeofusca]|uniref:helix-turn-helix domain-containing protein n=1 Tax=Kitasatospora purpeofusca TaxID=67352 RepID=UPI0036BE7015